MNLEKLRYLATEFLKIFLFFLGIRLLLQLLNQKPFVFEEVLRDHIPMAALFALLYSLIRMVFRPKK